MRKHGLNAIKRRHLVEAAIVLSQYDLRKKREIQAIRHHPIMFVLLKPGDSLILDSCA